ncbi:MAG: TIGR02391 family protein [Candidatus Moranbacteria bacterium]|nr:TIGR02391 family protein [Candidatus Moranbacteria bacterium]
MELEKIIEKAESLKNIRWDSPVIKIWSTSTKKIVATNFGDEYAKIFEVSLMPRVYSRDIEVNQRNFIARIDGVIDFLRELKNVNPEEKSHRSEKIIEVEVNKLSLLDGIHLEIYDKCDRLFTDCHYAEAVEKSFKVVKDRLRSLTGFEKGSDAFGNGKLHINGAAAHNVEEDFNKGVKFLLMAIDMFRNEKSHTSNARIDDPQKAVDYIRLSSLAMNLLDQAEIRK